VIFVGVPKLVIVIAVVFLLFGVPLMGWIAARRLRARTREARRRAGRSATAEARTERWQRQERKR